MASSRLNRGDIVRLFEMLNAMLAGGGTVGELYVVGGCGGTSTSAVRTRRLPS